MLEVEGLTVVFTRYRGLLRQGHVEAVRGIDLRVAPGEMVALVGESGGGKSLFAHAVLGLLPPVARCGGRIAFEGRELGTGTKAGDAALRRRRMALVPQGVAWLDPTAVAGRQLGWAARAAGEPGSRDAVLAEFARYGLGPEVARLFPHELSGGMARRVLTAMATISGAGLLIADEPTTGLDPERRDAALRLLRALADKGRAVIVITHDVSAALPLADRVVVVEAGRSVEAATGADFAAGTLSHPFSRALRAALPEHAARPQPGPAAHRPVFEARSLSFRWPRGRQILDDVSFRVGAGEVVGLRGPSGTGKTTLARVVGGYLAPDAGEVLLDGRRLPSQGLSPIQVVGQHAETTFNPRWRIGRSLAEGWAPDAATRALFGIRDAWLERFPHELSGGELQRAAVVRALAPSLRVLVTDELTASHDAITQGEIWRGLLDVARARGIAVIAVSHDAGLLRSIGARVASLRDGRLTWEDAPAEASLAAAE